MKKRSRLIVVCLLFALASLPAPLAVGSINDFPDNAYWPAGSRDAPCIIKDGVAWVPRVYRHGSWSYMPVQVAAVMDVPGGAEGELRTVTIKGRTWSVVKKSSGWGICAPWEWDPFAPPPAAEPARPAATDSATIPPALAIGLAVLGGLLLLLAFVAFALLGRAWENEEAVGVSRAVEVAAQKRCLDVMEARVQERNRKVDKRSKLFDAWKFAEEQRLEKVSETLERDRKAWDAKTIRERTMLAVQESSARGESGSRPQNAITTGLSAGTRTGVAKATVPATTAKAAKDPEKVDDFLRDLVLTRMVSNGELTVRSLASPTGRVALEWAFNNQRHSTRMVIRRDDKVVLTDSSSENRMGDQLVRGKRYVYSFETGGSGANLSFELSIPTPSQWGRTAKAGGVQDPLRAGIEGFTARLQELHEAKTLAYEKIKSWNFPEEERERWLAELDAWIAGRVDEG